MLRGIGGRRPEERPAAPSDATAGRTPQDEGGTGIKEYGRREAAPSGELNALLGRGSEFDGKLSFEGTVRIDGTFTGEITTSDTLLIGEDAKVTAEIQCGSVVINGEVTGNIHAAQGVEMHRPARVKGDVTSPSLMIEKGVVFEGHSRMESATASNVVRLASAQGEGAGT